MTVLSVEGLQPAGKSSRGVRAVRSCRFLNTPDANSARSETFLALASPIISRPTAAHQCLIARVTRQRDLRFRIEIGVEFVLDFFQTRLICISAVLTVIALSSSSSTLP